MAEIDGQTVRCAVVLGENGYDVALRYEPQTLRLYCECTIRNVFPEEKRTTVVRLLKNLTQSRGAVGGAIGIHATAGDLMWRTYCEARGVPVDGQLVHEVMYVGVGTFHEMVQQVRKLVEGVHPWTDWSADGEDAHWN